MSALVQLKSNRHLSVNSSLQIHPTLDSNSKKIHIHPSVNMFFGVVNKCDIQSFCTRLNVYSDYSEQDYNHPNLSQNREGWAQANIETDLYKIKI